MIPQTTTTMKKFGHPATLIADFEWWSVLWREKQPTLGSLVLAAKAEATAFSALPRAAFCELGPVTAKIESGLKAFCSYERINYLMLMMVDPHPHFHVIPRYSGVRAFEGAAVTDHGWPGPPALDRTQTLASDEQGRAIAQLAALCAERPP